MGMTMTQKILAAHAGLPSVKAGDLILARLDLVLGNDVTTPVAIREFNKLGKDKVFDRTKVTMVMDHFTPNKDIKAATQCKMCREFAAEMDKAATAAQQAVFELAGTAFNLNSPKQLGEVLFEKSPCKTFQI